MNRLALTSIFTLLGCAALIAIGHHVYADGRCGFEGQYYEDNGTCDGPQNPGNGNLAVVSLAANPSTIQNGNSSSLSWSWDTSANPNLPETCVIDQGIGSVNPSGGPVTVSPSSNKTYTITCSHQYCGPQSPAGGCTLVTDYEDEWTSSASVTVTAAPKPTVSLTASPTTVVAGSSSKLTWGSTNATSCTGSGFSTGNAKSGSVNVSPTSTKTYSVTCTGLGGSATASASVTVYPVLSGSCSASPTTVVAGGSTTWTAAPSGGTGTYTYAWSGTDSLSGTGKTAAKAYSTTGTKTASVKVTSGTQSKTIACGNSVTVYPVLAASCSVSPASVYTGGSATWTASPSGGTGTYTYVWSGTDSLSGTGKTVTKAYTATGTKTGTVKVTSGTQSKTVNCSNSLSVADAPKPDLTAGAVTPTSATAGTAVTLKATISNVTAATGVAFTDLFQRATDSSGTGATDIGTYSSAALAAGGSNTASKSYTFSAGTWYVRACADKSSAGNGGVIAESNESNNCGAWTKVVVKDLPPTCSLTASPSDKVPSTLTWSCTHTTSCTGGGFSTGGATSGTKSVTTAGNYTLSGTGSGGSCSDSVSLAAPCANPTADISADPIRVVKGGTTTLTYGGGGTDAACTVSGPGVSVTSAAPTSCTVSPATIPNVVINTQSTYTVTCGAATKSVIVNVVPDYSEF